MKLDGWENYNLCTQFCVKNKESIGWFDWFCIIVDIHCVWLVSKLNSQEKCCLIIFADQTQLNSNDIWLTMPGVGRGVKALTL